MERILLEGMAHIVGQGAEKSGTVEGGGDRRGAIGLCDVPSATYMKVLGLKGYNIRKEGTFPWLPFPRSHAVMGMAPHAVGTRIRGPTKDGAMVWETQVTALLAKSHNVVAATTDAAAEQ